MFGFAILSHSSIAFALGNRWFVWCYCHRRRCCFFPFFFFLFVYLLMLSCHSFRYFCFHDLVVLSITWFSNRTIFEISIHILPIEYVCCMDMSIGQWRKGERKPCVKRVDWANLKQTKRVLKKNRWKNEMKFKRSYFIHLPHKSVAVFVTAMVRVARCLLSESPECKTTSTWQAI